MNKTGLQLRMAVVGSILFGLYLAAAWFFHLLFDIDLMILVLLSIVLLPAGQYKLGKWLAVRSSGAEDMPEDDPRYRKVHQMTESLCRDMGMEKPRLMVAQMGVPNAFATGRKGAGIVVVSEELMRILDDDELEGVVAHELAHLNNRDTVMMTLGQSIATVVSYAVFFVVQAMGEDGPGFLVAWLASMVANFLVMLLVMAISRYREYVADDTARQYVGSGDPLARALEKISRSAENRESAVQDSGVNALCIFNGDRSALQQIMSTHPPTEKRIEKLRS
ncbi:M48 family metallopeptidase [Halopiger goleimassiliensis]|uniref:M48 family metallopeptidase n=1 Tax=Halopiger goleimassiliensis TaxID=1293048 RepID=UPI0006777C57|nr:M48 family metalloprotease [Halopiger goleimassiliensis]